MASDTNAYELWRKKMGETKRVHDEFKPGGKGAKKAELDFKRRGLTPELLAKK